MFVKMCENKSESRETAANLGKRPHAAVAPASTSDEQKSLLSDFRTAVDNGSGEGYFAAPRRKASKSALSSCL